MVGLRSLSQIQIKLLVVSLAVHDKGLFDYLHTAKDSSSNSNAIFRMKSGTAILLNHHWKHNSISWNLSSLHYYLIKNCGHAHSIKFSLVSQPCLVEYSIHLLELNFQRNHSKLPKTVHPHTHFFQNFHRNSANSHYNDSHHGGILITLPQFHLLRSRFQYTILRLVFSTVVPPRPSTDQCIYQRINEKIIGLAR